MVATNTAPKILFTFLAPCAIIGCFLYPFFQRTGVGIHINYQYGYGSVIKQKGNARKTLGSSISYKRKQPMNARKRTKILEIIRKTGRVLPICRIYNGGLVPNTRICRMVPIFSEYTEKWKKIRNSLKEQARGALTWKII